MTTVINTSYSFPRTYLITIVAMGLGIFNHLIFLGLFYYYDILPIYYYNYFSVFVFSALLFAVIKKKVATTAMVIASIEILIHQSLAVHLFGWDYGFQYYIIAIPGLILLGDFYRWAVPIVLSIISIFSILILYQYAISHTPVYQLTEIKSILYIYNLLSVAILVAIFSGIFAFTSRQNESILLKTHDQLYISATTDSMTRLSNRMNTFNSIESQNVRVKRSGLEFTLAIADVDNFKAINDNYGHDTGDAVLIEIAQILKAFLREQDIIGRWGGEEFMIVLPDTNIDNGKKALEKLRQTISNHTFNANDTALKVTMTFGVSVSNPSYTSNQLIKLADDALYKGKRGTKNCIVISDDGTATV